MSNSHEESLPQYYNYTNKGQTYQFDLTQLTPEERRRFMKLNERQKMKIITLMDLKDEGKMKNEHDLRPAYIDEDENKRENDLRTLTAKKEATEQLIEELKRDEEKKKLTLKDDKLYDIIQSNPEYALITKTDIDKIKAVNPTATAETLKKYYEELIKDLKVEGESFRVKKAIMGHPLTPKALQAKPELLKKLFTETNGLLSLLVNNTQFLYPQARDVKMLAEDRVKQEEVQEAQKILGETLPSVLNVNKTELKKTLESPEKVKELKAEIDNFVNDLEPSMSSQSYYSAETQEPLAREDFSSITLDDNTIKELNNILKENIDEKQMMQLIDSLSRHFGIDQIIVNDIINDDNLPSPLTYADVYKLIRGYMVHPEIPIPAPIEKLPERNSELKWKDYETAIKSFGSTLVGLSKENPKLKPVVSKYIEDRIKSNSPYKSGSIKDKVWKIFHPNAEKFKNIQAETENTKDELMKAKSDIDSLKSELKSLRQEIQELRKKELSLETRPLIQSPAQESKQSFLSEITKPHSLKPRADLPEKQNKIEENDLESDLRNAMIRRREDIAPDSEDEDDSEEWGEGLRRFNNPCGRAGKMKLSDYLRKM